MDRSLQGLAKRFALVLCTLFLGAALLSSCSNPPAPAAPPTPPAQYQSPWWTNVLGTDQALTPATLAPLGDLRKSDLSSQDATALASMAKVLAAAELSGQGRDEFPSYFAGYSPQACKDVVVHTASPVSLPVSTGSAVDTTQWAKILVTYSAVCPHSPLTASDIQVMYIYAHLTSSWQPVHEYQVPGSQNADPALADTAPADWQMTHFSTCGNPANAQFRDLVAVVDSFELMCAAAEKAGVHISITAGFRTQAEQAALFEQAISVYGSAAKARQYVAFANSHVCESRHCAGAAITVSDDSQALTWLHATVGCISNTAITLGPKSCQASDVSISRLQRYGFASPAPQIPSYLDYVLPTSPTTQNCNPPASYSSPQIIAAVFRCRLAAAGIPAETVKNVVASALVVSACESEWNPNARAFAGKWATTPYPVDGRTYTNEGLFMINQADAETYGISGAPMTDPVANANAAASMWLASNSFEDFGCATGRGVFDHGPVLPYFGGPALPSWAFAY